MNRPILFGNKDVSAVYRKAKSFLINNEVFLVNKFEDFGQEKRLTLCGLWQIVKSKDGEVSMRELSLDSMEWVECTDHFAFNKIKFFPINKKKFSVDSLDKLWRELVFTVIEKVLSHFGYYEVAGKKDPYRNLHLGNHSSHICYRDNSDHCEECQKERNMRSLKACASRLTSSYIGKYDKDGRLNVNSMRAGLVAFNRDFYKHFVDSKIISAISLIDRQSNLSVANYIHIAKHANGLLKVLNERRNLTPLLIGIDPKHWLRDDLFSEKIWVRGGRTKTIADRPYFRAQKHIYAYKFQPFSFVSAGSWRWLSKASPVIVAMLVRNCSDSIDRKCHLIENLSRIRLSQKVPVIAYTHILKDWDKLRWLSPSDHTQNFLRCFLSHCAKMWASEGHENVRRWLKTHDAQLRIVLDYLEHEGFRQGLPDKNSTWTSLLRRSRQWHERTLSGQLINNLSWSSAIESMTLSGYEFFALTSSAALYAEGQEMRHCVRSYDRACYSGNIRVFRVSGPESHRSTLSLWVDNKNQRCSIDQHYEKYNSNVSIEAQKIGKEFCEKYQNESFQI